MKLQKSTLILLLGALALGGGIYIYNSQVAVRREQQQTAEQKLFDLAEADVQAITLQLAGTSLQLERQPLETTGTSVWQLIQPNQPPELANDATVAFLLNTFVTGSSTEQFAIERDRLAEFGLDRPLSTTTITLEDQQQYRLLLGDTDFSGEHRYALIEALPTTQGGESTDSEQTLIVRVVPLQLEYATVRPPSDWLAPADPDQAATAGGDPELDSPLIAEPGNTLDNTLDSTNAAE